eukprot:3936353-Rhodomonas_salina.1
MPSGAYKLRTTVTKTRMPVGRARYNVQDTDFQIYNLLQETTQYQCTQEWLDEQAAFFTGMTAEELEILITYSYRGDKIINDFLMYGYPLFLSLPRAMLKPGFFLLRTTSFGSTLLFESQVRRFLHSTGLQVPITNEKLSHIVDTAEASGWKQMEWDSVLTDYHSRTMQLFEKAPRLTRPLTVYRGERKTHAGEQYIFPSLHETMGRKYNSFSLDSSVAAFFARDYLKKGRVEYGTIYCVTFPIGAQLLLTAGCNQTTDIVEMEVRVAPEFDVVERKRVT